MQSNAISTLKAIDVEAFKAHPSSLIDLMGGYKDHLFTEDDQERLDFLNKKEKGEIFRKGSKTSVLKITEKESKELKNLRLDKENQTPILSKGAKTQCKKWLGHKLFNDRTQLATKEIEKGNKTESEGLEMAANHLDVFLSENKTRKENAFISYEIDAEFSKDGKRTILDNKSSWSSETFPCWEFDKEVVKRYWWQGQGYMGAENADNYVLSYTLTNAPYEIVERFARQHIRYNGLDQELDFPESFDKMKSKLTYDDVAEDLKIKLFRFDASPKDYAFIEPVVKLCRKYIQKLINQRIEELENK